MFLDKRIAVATLISALLWQGQSVLAQRSEFPIDGPFDGPFDGPIIETPTDSLPPYIPPPSPPPVVPDPPPTSSFPSFTFPILPTFRPPVVVPTDVTSAANYQQLNAPMANAALNGIQKIPPSLVPKEPPAPDNPDGILVKWAPGTIYKMIQNNVVELVSGELLISIKSPASHAHIITPFGKLALDANSDILVSFENGVLRLKNLDGVGMKVKAKLDQGPFAGKSIKAVTVAPGYEFTAADHVLSRSELRPKDGVARRFMKVLEEGQLAISEFSPASALQGNALVADLRQSVNGVKERRILSDLSKMAAVLNHQMGSQGFTESGKEDGSRLAGLNSKVN